MYRAKSLRGSVVTLHGKLAMYNENGAVDIRLDGKDFVGLLLAAFDWMPTSHDGVDYYGEVRVTVERM